jgi:hypothetical protein
LRCGELSELEVSRVGGPSAAQRWTMVLWCPGWVEQPSTLSQVHHGCGSVRVCALRPSVLLRSVVYRLSARPRQGSQKCPRTSRVSTVVHLPATQSGSCPQSIVRSVAG